MSHPLPHSAASKRGLRQWLHPASLENAPVTPVMVLVIATLVVLFAGDLFRYTIGWVGYGIVVAVIAVLFVIVLVRANSPLRLRHLPIALVAFVVWCALTVIWSRYRLETAGGSVVQIVTAMAALTTALTLTRFQFVRVLGIATRLMVYLSLVFELVANLWSPGGIVPPTYYRDGVLESLLGTDDIPSPLPGNFYWTHADMFLGGPIQGVMGNRNLLAMVALIALIATVAELFDRVISRYRGILGIAAAVIAIALTQSATIYVGLAFVALGVLLVYLGRRFGRRTRWIMYAVVAVALTVGAYVAIAFNNQIFALMNRTPDMSGRGDVWSAVIEFGSASPAIGAGWISYWAPWLPEFHSLAVVEGMPYHQAHNAFLDVWMQTGFFGLVIFIGLVVTTFIRTWWIAIDRPDTPVIASSRASGTPHLAGTTAVPFLLMVALVVQSMTESRLLVEGCWFLLTYFAIYSKLRVQDLSILPRHTVSDRTGPITLILDPARDP